jgi:vancomycin resistance protein VanJ
MIQRLLEPKTIGMDASPPSRAAARLRCLVALCSWLYVPVVAAAWMVLESGDSCWLATLWMFSPRWLLALPLLPLLALAAWRRRRSLPLLLFLLLLIAGPIMGFRIPWRTMISATPPGPRLRVATLNMHYQRPHREAMKRLLAETRPDVLVVQELPGSDPFAYFADSSWRIHRAYGHFLASRFPIRRAERLGRDTMTPPGSLFRYEVETPAGTVTLFSLHFASPRDPLFEATHHPTTGWLELEDNSDVRREQIENVRLRADECGGPVLLMGDFNTPTESVLFDSLSARCRDAFVQAGWGWGYTFLNARTTVRIDHIWMGPGWHAERCWVGAHVGPPHRPLFADLIWTRSAARQNQPPG